MDNLFITAVFLIGLVTGSGLTLCLAALAAGRDPDEGQSDVEYL